MILVDTSILVWIYAASDRLGLRARQRLDAEHVVHFSSISIAELMIKAMLGKIEVPDRIGHIASQRGLTEAGFTAEHAAAVRTFPELAKHDPFDRMLMAQARSAGMDFMTSDRALLRLGYDFIVDATV